MPININPQSSSDWGSFASGCVAVLAALWAIISWPYKTFITNKTANRMFLKISEPDGTRNYVHPSEFEEVKLDIKAIKEIVEKWQ